MKKHGPWTIRETHQVYQDPYIRVTRDDVIRPDGDDGSHVKVYLKPGVSVLPIDADGQVYLTREFHYAVGRMSLELVSGGIEPGENAESTALRELEEELGIRADHLIDLGVVDPFTTIVESPTRLYVATGLSFGETQQEGTEEIECVQMPFSDALDLVLNGSITHAPSCVAILKANLMREATDGLHAPTRNRPHSDLPSGPEPNSSNQ